MRELPGAWVTSLMTWPAVLLATFRFVPVYAQPAMMNVFAILWDGFLSHRNAVATEAQKEAQPLTRRRTTARFVVASSAPQKETA